MILEEVGDDVRENQAKQERLHYQKPIREQATLEDAARADGAQRTQRQDRKQRDSYADQYGCGDVHGSVGRSVGSGRARVKRWAIPCRNPARNKDRSGLSSAN